MKSGFLFALILLSALPAVAQTTEFGVIVGGSRRFIEGAPRQTDDAFIESNFSFANNSFDLYWAFPIEPAANLKFKLGRIESAVAFPEEVEGDPNVYRRDVEGEVQHAAVIVDYRFDERFGSTGIFGGLGLYRQTGPGFDAQTDYGFTAGINADFPISRRYGFILESAYHWTRGEFRPRYLTLGGGLRIAF